MTCLKIDFSFRLKLFTPTEKKLEDYTTTDLIYT